MQTYIQTCNLFLGGQNGRESIELRSIEIHSLELHGSSEHNSSSINHRNSYSDHHHSSRDIYFEPRYLNACVEYIFVGLN